MHSPYTSKIRTLLITGGAGFIGSAYVRMALSGQIHGNSIEKIKVIDSLTYAGDVRRFETYQNDHRLEFVNDDICNYLSVEQAVSEVDAIIHFAAESHVDRSIESGDNFINTNVLGTHMLLKAAQKYSKRIVLVSTDEVYGSISEGKAAEDAPLNPSSPYSASKAAADLIALSYFATYGLDVRITRCANNFGKYQNKEKFIPTIISSILNDIEIPIYGDGKYTREWLHTDDHCSAIAKVLEFGEAGEIYNISGGEALSNLELVKLFSSKFKNKNVQTKFVKDRLGHDRRYAVDDQKIKNQLGWEKLNTLEESLDEVIDSYLQLEQP